MNQRNFTTSLVAVAALISQAYAQLPRQCFFVTELEQTSHTSQADLLSDLPALIENYRPGMKLSALKGYLDGDDDDYLTGIQAQLYDTLSKRSAELTLIGTSNENNDTVQVTNTVNDPIERISILTNENGVCDFVVYQGKSKKATYMQKSDPDCVPEVEGVSEKTLRITDDAPLVGFHGMADSQGLYALGAIFVDTFSTECQYFRSDGGFSMYSGMSDFEASTAVEDQITPEERKRAKALEALLVYDNMQKAR